MAYLVRKLWLDETLLLLKCHVRSTNLRPPAQCQYYIDNNKELYLNYLRNIIKTYSMPESTAGRRKVIYSDVNKHKDYVVVFKIIYSYVNKHKCYVVGF